MRIILTSFVALLLLINSFSGLYGGLNLIMHTDGSSLGMSVNLLNNTPFIDYFVPGILLLFSNGLLSFAVFLTLVFGFRISYWLIIVQGSILTSWIIIQIFMLHTVVALHLLMITMGVLMIISGFKLIQLTSEKYRRQKIEKNKINVYFE